MSVIEIKITNKLPWWIRTSHYIKANSIGHRRN